MCDLWTQKKKRVADPCVSIEVFLSFLSFVCRPTCMVLASVGPMTIAPRFGMHSVASDYGNTPSLTADRRHYDFREWGGK